jgi:hypothetical protein
MSYLPDLNAPGSIVLKDSPATRFHWRWWEDNGSPASRMDYNVLAQTGFKPALAAEWILAPWLRDTIVPDSNGRLTFAASKDGAHVVMYQGEADYRKLRKLITRDSDYVQQTAEERAAKLQEELERGGLRGVRASVSFEEE